MPFEPITLQGEHVRLEPLAVEHLNGLCEFGLDPELWRFTTTQLYSREDVKAYVETALRSQEEGTALPFATIDLDSGHVIGCTRWAISTATIATLRSVGHGWQCHGTGPR